MRGPPCSLLAPPPPLSPPSTLPSPSCSSRPATPFLLQVFQEEIFGPVTGVTTFKTEEEAIAIANDTIYGLGAGVWTRDAHQAYQVPRAIEAGRVWVNCYHAYPAHAPFGGYKQSGFGRETHKMMLAHYRQTKNMLISLDKNKLGFF